MVPILETERLRLRIFCEDDLVVHAKTLGDPVVMRFLGGVPQTREETWRRMLAMVGSWSVFGFGYWAVERISDGAFLGQMGFADYRRAMVPSLHDMPEMGWVFAPDAHGQGYAQEAGRAALSWADRALPGREIVAIIDHGNEASIRLAEKLGFSSVEEALYKDGTILLFRRPPVLPAAAAATATAAA